jgi:hypothetical protein
VAVELKVCDFCGRSGVAWSYPARDVEISLDGIPGVPAGAAQESRGEWLACEGCHELIQLTDRQALQARALENVSANVPGVVEFIRRAHDHFWQAREGRPQRLEAAA